MKKYIIKITSIIFVISLQVNAQQTSLFNTYSFDLMQLNIASIGRTCTEANLNYRSQWLGVKETPRLYQLNAAVALGKSNGLGLKVYQQSMGLLKVTNATLGYSYRVKLNETTKLHFGLGVAFQQNNFEANKTVVIDNNDVSINNNQQRLRSNNFDSEAGVLLLANKLTFGLSAIHLYNTNRSFNSVGYNSKPEANIIFAYKFNKGKSLEIEPWLVDRYSFSGNTNNFEGMLNFKFKQIFTAGAGYRLNYGYLALIGVELNKIKIAYSFDYTSGKNAKSLGSSHQILLGFDLCKSKNKKPIETPVVVTPTVISEPVKEIPVMEEIKKEEIVVKETVETKAPSGISNDEKINLINKLADEVIFDLNKSVLNNDALARLEKISTVLKTNLDLKIKIVGHTCNIGSKDQNELLAFRRANYVRNELIKLGVKETQIEQIVGISPEVEIYDNNTKNKPKNRTVRFVETK